MLNEKQLDLIDREVSIKVLQLKKKKINNEFQWVDNKTGEPFVPVKHWSPSRDCNAANSVMDSIPTTVQVFKYDAPMINEKQYSCSIRAWDGEADKGCDVRHYDQTMPLAICGAALKLVGVDMVKLVQEVKKGKKSGNKA